MPIAVIMMTGVMRVNGCNADATAAMIVAQCANDKTANARNGMRNCRAPSTVAPVHATAQTPKKGCVCERVCVSECVCLCVFVCVYVYV